MGGLGLLNAYQFLDHNSSALSLRLLEKDSGVGNFCVSVCLLSLYIYHLFIIYMTAEKKETTENHIKKLIVQAPGFKYEECKIIQFNISRISEYSKY